VNGGPSIGLLRTERETIPGGENSGCPGSRSRYAVLGYVLRRVLVRVRESVDFPEDLGPVMRITGGCGLGVVKSERRGSQADGVVRIPGGDVEVVRRWYVSSLFVVLGGAHTPPNIGHTRPISRILELNLPTTISASNTPSFSCPLPALLFGKASITGNACVLGAHTPCVPEDGVNVAPYTWTDPESTRSEYSPWNTIVSFALRLYFIDNPGLYTVVLLSIGTKLEIWVAIELTLPRPLASTWGVTPSSPSSPSTDITSSTSFPEFLPPFSAAANPSSSFLRRASSSCRDNALSSFFLALTLRPELVLLEVGFSPVVSVSIIDSFVFFFELLGFEVGAGGIESLIVEEAGAGVGDADEAGAGGSEVEVLAWRSCRRANALS